MARQQDRSVLLYSGVTAQTIEVQEGTTAASYEDGDLVRFDTTGQIILAATGIIAGIATEDATASSGSASDVQAMELIDINALYLMTAGDLVATAQADCGNNVNIDFTAGAQFAETTSSTPEINIVGIYPGDLAVAGGRYIIRFNMMFFAGDAAT